jgi:formylglycine-generating enzyme required for sulfatase activity
MEASESQIEKVGTSPRYDVFVSYHWQDHEDVETLAQALRDRGLSVFLDRWYLVPGRPWPQALEETLSTCRAVAFVLGPNGMGRWQQREKYLALERQAHDRSFPVIPVLLPGADPALGFLSQNTWVDFRNRSEDPVVLDILAKAARGEPPGPDLRYRMQAALASVCPYRGLNAFREEDAAFFFGREVFTAKLIKALEAKSLVAVVGPSGSGKSSVVRAGLVPYLRELRRSETDPIWEVASLFPSDRPVHTLAGALVPLLEPQMSETDRLVEVGKLAHHFKQGDVSLRDVVSGILKKQPGTDRLLLIADQWEELYTLCHDEHVRRRFIDQLLEATTFAPISVVLTLRGDFFGQALSYRALSDRLQDAQVNLAPMTRQEREEVVTKPAEKVGLGFEPGLVASILDEVGEEPGNLPLLEFALTQLWAGRQAGQLNHEAYEAMGKVAGAIVTKAEDTYRKFKRSEQALTRQTFIQLVRPGEASEDTRRRATFVEIGEAARPLVRQLADARLLVTGRDETTGEETVEVAHEALIRNWDRLQGWVDERRDDLRVRQQLRVAAETWQDHDQGEGYLWSHERVMEAAHSLQRLGPHVHLNETEQRFLGPIDRDRMLNELDDPAIVHERRAAIGVRLSLLGDPRSGVGLRQDGLPDIVWYEVPGGEITLEVEQAERSRISRWLKRSAPYAFEVKPFHIAKYPVTWIQYRAFLEAHDGFSRPAWWQGLWFQVDKPGRQFNRRDNHPAENVCWLEAVAFCRWLTEHLAHEIRERFGEGYVIRLPTEWEWQQAATGGDRAHEYPWGPEWDSIRTNTYESELSHSTAVGMYPQGASPVGALDMSGNVWEWCLNEFDHPTHTDLSGEVRRVLRGGSWNLNRGYARAAYRLWVDPGDRYDDVGVRLVCSSPIL